MSPSTAQTSRSKEITKLAELVQREDGVQVKFGRTNGCDCLHIFKTERMDKPPRLSYTIYTEADWATHAWNNTDKKERRVNTDIENAVKNKEAQ